MNIQVDTYVIDMVVPLCYVIAPLVTDPSWQVFLKGWDRQNFIVLKSLVVKCKTVKIYTFLLIFFYYFVRLLFLHKPFAKKFSLHFLHLWQIIFRKCVPGLNLPPNKIHPFNK